MIPYGHQDITQIDIDAVTEVLTSEFLTQGPAVPRFEAMVAERVGTAHGVAVNSATSALHIACLALDLGPGDLLWTSPVTFVASANCGRYCGADIDFVDIDPRTYNMSATVLAAKLQEAEANGRLPKIIVPVHLTGQPCDMAAIGALAKRYGVAVVEDASHAIGALDQGTPVGACVHSDITVFSFHPVKIITTAEGGMAMTQNTDLAARMERLRSHGITRDPDLMTHASDGPWYYQQLELGFNYRMTELQAALGCAQMTRLEAFVARRHVIADRYATLLADLPVTLPYQAPGTYSAYHLYVINLQDGTAPHHTVFTRLRAAGIGVNLHYIPVHLQPYYADIGFTPGDFPASETYYAGAISIPMYPGLTEEAQDQVVAALRTALIP